MPTSESGDNNRRAAARAQQQNYQQQQAPAPLACPRCDSVNTKFCYYNNYNLSQPRHFCKACRRYWTHGGTLRDVPVGGGSRKNSKRSRSSSSATSSSASSSSEAPLFSPEPLLSDPTLFKPEPNAEDPAPNPNPNPNESASSVGGALGFTSLLNSQAPGFLALGGYGYGSGLGHGLDDMGFGYGGRAGVWPFGEQVGGGDFGGSGGPGVACNTWQINGGSDGGLVDSVDCFAWPELSISMPGNGLK